MKSAPTTKPKCTDISQAVWLSYATVVLDRNPGAGTILKFGGIKHDHHNIGWDSAIGARPLPAFSEVQVAVCYDAMMVDRPGAGLPGCAIDREAEQSYLFAEYPGRVRPMIRALIASPLMMTGTVCFPRHGVVQSDVWRVMCWQGVPRLYFAIGGGIVAFCHHPRHLAVRISATTAGSPRNWPDTRKVRSKSSSLGTRHWSQTGVETAPGQIIALGESRQRDDYDTQSWENRQSGAQGVAKPASN